MLCYNAYVMLFIVMLCYTAYVMLCYNAYAMLPVDCYVMLWYVMSCILAIFYPFSQFCEIDVSLPSL